ncbi:hypothetical protein I7I50_10698 [Histoplasma capsulatum G186AR]|uniref:Uncharacterized protein n=1 Tax=Ajellomyces capsulatus TaxID=5037 RepID=A0A8H8D6K2_AJECA|nr:hypothetical protein I7I52_01936 [Histoplasma capsulatum]QSS69413.1 hypothetical protein I7I50_10698 [Histoplasma capsulatum G186AR]
MGILPKNTECRHLGLASTIHVQYIFTYTIIHYISAQKEFKTGRETHAEMMLWLNNDINK